MTGAAAIAFCGGPRRSFRCASAMTAFFRIAKPCRRPASRLVILEMPGIGLDIDNPHELELLLCSARATPTRNVCCGRGDLARLAAQWEPASSDESASLDARAAGEFALIPVLGIPEVKAGDSIADLVVEALALGGCRFHAGDILVVKHKIVSKAEGRIVRLDSVKPSRRALATAAAKNNTDARVVELALREARRVLRDKHVLITETQHGFVCANSGVDVSNVDGGETAVLLPVDPDASAARIHRQLKKRTGLHIPVIIADSFGRAWREGLVRRCDRRCRNEVTARLSWEARRLWIHAARHRRGGG